MAKRPDPELRAVEAQVALTLTVDDFEAAARDMLPEMVFDYYAGGSGEEWTLRENTRAYGRWVIRPRVLVDVSNVEPMTTVLGQELPFPILLAPTAFQRMAHRDGELATAHGAASLGAIMVVSTIATVSLEDLAATGVRRWFQLYVLKDRGLTAALVKRAHAAGYEAIVLTVDTPLLGRRLRDERNSFALPPGIGLANLEGSGLPESSGSGLFSFFLERHDAALTWDDVAWLRSLSPLPLVLKGIVTAEDTRLAVDAGVDAIVVSNHGGRQLDGAPATLDVLPEVVEAAEGRIEVLLDGGIRRGSDVFKALALGARATLVGRPYLWGLAVNGADGVRQVLEIIRDDLMLTMALAGRPAIVDIDRSAVAPAPAARERGEEP
ncbi:MAG: alpha-hydroxy-acid oxidizing protein [Actinobacteria bacterium]|nr:MAG: alpha-hydroxy-acid oxidizing protein [Actinomycetota bacterium]